MTEASAATAVEPEQPADVSPETLAGAGSDARPASRKKNRSDDATGADRAVPALPGPDRLDLLGNIEMDVTAELGRTRMPVRQLLSLTPGMVVELDKMAGSPVDLLVNGTLIARGEVVVIDEEFGIRISEIVSPSNEAAR